MRSRARWLFAISACAAAALVTWSAARSRRHTHAPSEAPIDPTRWPSAEAPLRPVAARFPASSAAIKVMIDPGHGAANNHGNTSSFCVEEQDAMLELAAALADRLEETGHVEARLARDGRLVEYAARVDAAAAWGADVFVSLHSDARGRIDRWSPEPGRDCPIALDAPGFAVLYSDEGAAPLVAHRLALGRSVARHMIEAGFLPYDGAGYAGSYEADDARGVFADRHAADQRIYVLRRPSMPSVLIETHNALDPREAARWRDPDTLDAFASALAAAIADTRSLTRPGGT